jgi:prophage regulatory protein
MSTAPSSALQVECLIGQHEVRRRVCLSRTTIWRLQRADKFPRSVQLSPGRRGWLESEITAWIQERVEDSSKC